MKVMDTNEIPWKDYKTKLNIADKIYYRLYGKPTSSKSIAESYNIKGDIIRLILEDV